MNDLPKKKLGCIGSIERCGRAVMLLKLGMIGCRLATPILVIT